MRKKLSFVAILLFMVATTNINALIDVFKDCHAYACAVVAQYEEGYGGSLGDLEEVYSMAHEMCVE